MKITFESFRSSSEMNGMKGEMSLRPVSIQVTNVERAAAFLPSSAPWKMGFTDSYAKPKS